MATMVDKKKVRSRVVRKAEKLIGRQLKVEKLLTLELQIIKGGIKCVGKRDF